MNNGNIEFSERLKKLPPYLFVEIDKMKQKAISDGVDIINLGVGDPDMPTPEVIMNRMKSAIGDPENHHYPLGKGKSRFRLEIQSFLKKRYGIDMDSESQIHPLIGSKEGIAHFPLAFINPGDTVIVPEPAYPVYYSGTVFCGGEPYFIPLISENGFLPDLDGIPEDVLKKAKVLYLNYPNNPTGAMATEEFFQKTIEIAHRYGILVAHDAAYCDLYFDEPPKSILQTDGALSAAIEFHSLSKPFSMTGWRLGWACGNEELIKGLATVKDNIDSGVFGAIQDAGAEALENYDGLVNEYCSIYRERVRVMSDGLKSAGWKFEEPRATFYIWARPPVDIISADAVKRIINRAGIVCTPGSGFGPSGEGFVRFALTKEVDRLAEAIDRIKEISWKD
jgi:LL-diaminopimelate aminotransferase